MSDHHKRLENLLIDATTHDLTAGERRSLDHILHKNPELRDDSFELAAAALHLALQSKVEVMPESLRQQLKGE